MSGPATRPTMSGLQLEIHDVRKDQEAHEDVCAERYGRINDGMAQLVRRTGRIETMGWSLMVTVLILALGIIGFLFQQAYKPAAAPPVAVAVSK